MSRRRPVSTAGRPGRRGFIGCRHHVERTSDDVDQDELYRTVRRATRDAVWEALEDVLTVLAALLLVLLGGPLAVAGLSGDWPTAWLATVVGPVVVALGRYRLDDRFGRANA